MYRKVRYEQDLEQDNTRSASGARYRSIYRTSFQPKRDFSWGPGCLTYSGNGVKPIANIKLLKRYICLRIYT